LFWQNRAFFASEFVNLTRAADRWQNVPFAMILDTLANCADCTAMHSLLPTAFDYLRRFDPCTPDGKYPIDGDRLYAVVQRYETAPEETRTWETHRVYADIQLIVSGQERMIYAPAGNLHAGTPYNEAKDVQKYGEGAVKDASPLVVGAGSFCIFLPQDGHKPGCMVEKPEPVLKVVVKLRLKD